MKAVAIILRGRWTLDSLLIQARTWSRYSHAILLLDNGKCVEASARKNMVVYHTLPKNHPRGWERRLDLTWLGDDACRHIAGIALTELVGDKYDWRAGRGIALNRYEDDPRREICFEVIGLACKGFIDFGRASHSLTARHIAKTLGKLERARTRSMVG